MPLKTKFPLLLTELALCMHISWEFCLFFKLTAPCMFCFLGPRASRLSRNMVSILGLRFGQALGLGVKSKNIELSQVFTYSTNFDVLDASHY